MYLIYCALSPDRRIIMVITFRKMRWAEHITRIGEIRNFT